MSPPDLLARIDTDLRAAVASGDFAGAHGFWDQYAHALRGAASDADAAARLADAGRLIDWTRHTCAAARARAAEQLSQLASSSRYAQPPNERPHIFRLAC
jgi:hypothetical protein